MLVVYAVMVLIYLCTVVIQAISNKIKRDIVDVIMWLTFVFATLTALLFLILYLAIVWLTMKIRER